MNVTMPAPAPAGPPAAAPNDRVIGREHPTTSPTKNSTGPQADDERTFEEQLDDVAVALARTTPPAPIEAHTKQRTSPDPTGDAPGTTSATTGVAFAPPTTGVAATPATADASTPTDAVLATPAVGATASIAMTPAFTEIEGPSTVVPTALALETAEQVANGIVQASAGDAQTRPLPGPASTDVPIADVPALPGPIAAPDAGQVAAASPTALVAAAQAAAGATIDAPPETVSDAVTDAVTETVSDAVTDTTTQATFAIHAPSAQHDDASPTTTGGPAPVIAESADDLAPPTRIAPPRTIALDLNDEGLGPLRVIATSDQRTIHLTVSASEAVVRDALVRQQSDLRNDLADAGLQLGSFDVDSRAADRDHANQPTVTGERDRLAVRPGGATATTAPIPSTHDADGRLDLRL